MGKFLSKGKRSFINLRQLNKKKNNDGLQSFQEVSVSESSVGEKG